MKPSDLPSNAEIRDEIQRFAWLYEGDSRLDNLREMRITALRMMRHFKNFKPRLIGSTLTGHIRKGSDIDLHVFVSNIESVTSILDGLGLAIVQQSVKVHRGHIEIFSTLGEGTTITVELPRWSEESLNSGS